MNSHVKRNWRQYNQNLINRGSINFWISQDLYKSWREKSGKRGRPRFAQAVIQAAWMIKGLFHLPLRALQGFFDSLLNLLKLEEKSPHYSLICKRAKEASELMPKLSNRRPTDLVIDSSGLKIHGEGEWKVKVHGAQNRRGWIKLHIAVDPASQELISIEVSDDKQADSSTLATLVNKAPKSVRKVITDGAYDTYNCRKFLLERGIEACIPPRRNATKRQEKELFCRNDAIQIIKGLGQDAEALAIWKKLTGYHRRSLVETAFSRLKQITGSKLSTRSFANQIAEVKFRCHLLNRMIRISSIK